MGTKNADLIRATVRADQAAKFLSGLVLISQEECPHPADKQTTGSLRGPRDPLSCFIGLSY